MSQSITDKIFAEYENIRSKESLMRQKRIEQAHEICPELEEIRKEVASKGYSKAMELAKNPDREQQIRKELFEENEKLKKRREVLLKEYNIPEDYDKIRYECPICMDTGYAENQKCRCYKAKLTKYSYERSNLSGHMQEMSFDKFEFKYFPDVPEKDGISPLDRIRKIHSEAKQMCENFEEYKRSFLYFGDTGSGKTFLSGCIANALIEKGYSVLYITAGKLFELMENKKYGRQRDISDDELIETAYSCDMLILDDLGAEFPSKLRQAFAYDILNERILAGKKMIINTNLNLDELSREYSQRFVSRLFEHFYALRFVVKDIRKQKMYE